MTQRLVATLPILVATALYAFVTRSFVIASVVLVGLVLALPLARYLVVPPFAQRSTLLLVALFGAFGGVAALTSFEADSRTRPTELLGRLAVTALLLAVTRRFFSDPEGGVRFDFALLTTAIVACGEKHVGVAYVAAVVLFVVATVVVIRARDATIGWAVVEAHSLGVTATVVLIAGVLSTIGMIALPLIGRLTQRQFDTYVLPTGASHVGFTDRIVAGSPEKLVESSQPVLRIYGPRVDYLRGRVYDAFEHGSWVNSARKSADKVVTIRGRISGSGATEIRAVGALATPDPDARFFLPLGARRVRTSKGAVRVDEFGAYRPVPDEPATPIAFEVGAADHPVAPPTPVDLMVPQNIRTALEPLVIEWTRGATTPLDKLDAIERHLRQDFTYSLEGARPTSDPVVAFLFRTRTGRCELFATSLALLGRIVGVETRVVGGFRVAEHNSIGNYDVVREKNAHAWVEGWVSGGWRTFDPTPATEANMRRDGRSFAAFGDLLLATWDRGLELLGRAQLWQFGALLAFAVGLLTTVRLLRARRERLALVTRPDDGDAPLPFFAELEALLASHGHARAPSESLETFADRLRGASLVGVADIVSDYGAFRYGGKGDRDDIARRVRDCATELARTATHP